MTHTDSLLHKLQQLMYDAMKAINDEIEANTMSVDNVDWMSLTSSQCKLPRESVI